MSGQSTVHPVTAGRWQLDPSESTASFSVVHFGHVVAGTIPLRTADAGIGPDQDIQQAHIELDLTAIATGNDRRNKDLAKPRYLDTAQHPTMVVNLPPVAQGKNGWRTRATLMVRGVRAPMEIAIELRHPVAHDVAAVTVTGTFDRTPLGIKVPAFIIAKMITVRVDAVFRRVSG